LIAVCRGLEATAQRTPLHWLDVTDRVQFKLAVLVYRCLHGTAPLYMTQSCTQTADVVSRQHLRSASQRKMIVPRYRLDSYGRRCFAVVDPSTWKSLSDSLRSPESQHFLASDENSLFCEILTRRILSAVEIFYENALYKFNTLQVSKVLN